MRFQSMRFQTAPSRFSEMARPEPHRVSRQLYSGCFRRLVIGARRDHRVQGHEELPSRGDQGRFDRFSGGLKPGPELLECRTPSRGVQGGEVTSMGVVEKRP
jgi:hypothetical protein